MLLSVLPMLMVATVAHQASNQYGVTEVGPARQITPSIQCRTEYVTLWDTTYQEKEEQVCTTIYEKQCETRYQNLCKPTTREECHTEYEQQCVTQYKKVCVDQYSTVYEPYTETVCTTLYKEDCQYQWEGQGNDKVWAPIAGTCEQVPYDECKDVTKTHAKQVANQVCNDVPEQKCVSVPKQVCVTVPDQICTNEPLTECQDVPRQQCHAEHKRFPIRVSRQQAKKVCDPAQGYPAPAHVPAPATRPVELDRVQQAPSVSSLLDYASPAVPAQTLPEHIANRQPQQKPANDQIVFGGN